MKVSFSVERYGSGWMLAAYLANDALYFGRQLNGRRQPLVSDPFPSVEAAEAAIPKLAERIEEANKLVA
jgi:hypothetical protein